MRIRIEPGEADVRVIVTGEIDFREAGELVEQASGIVERGRSAGVLVLDLGGVTYCDSVGIAALVRIRMACDRAAWRLRLAHVGPAVRRLLDITGLGAWLEPQGQQPEP
jgi:anti-sigma B factor antagonist